VIRSARAGSVACSLAVVSWGVALILLLLDQSLAAGISGLVWVVVFAITVLLLHHRRRKIDS
jgi:hypothetical protein